MYKVNITLWIGLFVICLKRIKPSKPVKIEWLNKKFFFFKMKKYINTDYR